MAYREVAMVDVKEVLRLWLMGLNNTEIGKQIGVDRKTVRAYVRAARAAGLVREAGVAGLTDELLQQVGAAAHPMSGRPHGEGWARCEAHHAAVERLLRGEVRLSKVRRLLVREGVDIPYATLHRYCVERLGFGKTAATLPVVDGVPGEELAVDTGWVLTLTVAGGREVRRKAWVFTANVSRHRFVWPCERETTQSAIEACEAAWRFFGGVFRVLVPDNTKAIVQLADPATPRITPGFLEYAQARGFVVDPARVRRPQDKARVERSVRYVREDCFGGERLATLEDARQRALRWCEHEAGMRRHSTTQRMPREHFLAEEQPRLLPAPTDAYDIPLWSEPKVGRDQLCQVARALYSVPGTLRGKYLLARADQQLVRFYDAKKLVKTHARQPAGGRAIDPNDYPQEKTAYALRDVAFLQAEAAKHGEAVGIFARGLLDGPLPWTRMRQVHMLLRLCKRYGSERVNNECVVANSAALTDVYRLERIIQAAIPVAMTPAVAKIIPIARYLRDPSAFALARSHALHNPEDTHEC